MYFFCNNLFMKFLLNLKHFFRICFVELCKFFVVLVFSLFCVVPGLFCFADLSYSIFIAKKSPEMDMKGIFGLSKELADGERAKIILSLAISVVSVCLALVVSFAVIKFLGMFVNTTYLTYRIGVCLCGGFTLIFFAIPYYFCKLQQSFAVAQRKKYQKFES